MWTSMRQRQQYQIGTTKIEPAIELLVLLNNGNGNNGNGNNDYDNDDDDAILLVPSNMFQSTCHSFCSYTFLWLMKFFLL